MEVINQPLDEELSRYTTGFIYYFKKDKDGKWKIEELQYIDIPAATETWIEETLEKLKKKK